MKKSGFKPRDKPMARGTSKLKPIGARAKRTGQGKVPPTPEERAWMDAIIEFGCVVCWLQNQEKTPCVVHHIVECGRRLGHMWTIGLCQPGHHMDASQGSKKISRHPWKARFEIAYGDEYELLEFLKSVIRVLWRDRNA